MHQRWGNITFLHWSCEPHLVQARLPQALQPDVHDGVAWIGLTPFFLSNLRGRFLPPLPWISAFPETNLRTYVRGPSGPGVWFFSLDAARFPAVVGARMGLGLPYYWADMRVTLRESGVHYYSSRGGRAQLDIEVQTGARIERPSELDKFLTARFRLYSVRRGRLLSVEVEHPPWPLHDASALRVTETMRSAAGLSFGEMHRRVLFSPGVDTVIGAPAAVREL